MNIMSPELLMPDGSRVNGHQENFSTNKENWNLYELDDGTIIKIKLVPTEIYRLDSVDPSTGKSQFLVKTTTIVTSM